MVELELVKDWARQAGGILQGGFGKKHHIDFKGEIDLVTEMDRISEDYLLGEVHKHDPKSTILSEESGEKLGSSQGCWLIDPLDGTINYAHHIPIFTVSIAYQEDGDLKLAAVYDPMRDEMFSAQRGRGAWLNSEALHVSQTTELVKSLLITGFPYDIRTNDHNNLDHFAYFALRTQGVRRLGSAALDLAYVAAGRFDGTGNWASSLGILRLAS